MPDIDGDGTDDITAPDVSARFKQLPPWMQDKPWAFAYLYVNEIPLSVLSCSYTMSAGWQPGVISVTLLTEVGKKLLQIVQNAKSFIDVYLVMSDGKNYLMFKDLSFIDGAWMINENDTESTIQLADFRHYYSQSCDILDLPDYHYEFNELDEDGNLIGSEDYDGGDDYDGKKFPLKQLFDVISDDGSGGHGIFDTTLVKSTVEIDGEEITLYPYFEIDFDLMFKAIQRLAEENGYTAKPGFTALSTGDTYVYDKLYIASGNDGDCGQPVTEDNVPAVFSKCLLSSSISSDVRTLPNGIAVILEPTQRQFKDVELVPVVLDSDGTSDVIVDLDDASYMPINGWTLGTENLLISQSKTEEAKKWAASGFKWYKFTDIEADETFTASYIAKNILPDLCISITDPNNESRTERNKPFCVAKEGVWMTSDALANNTIPSLYDGEAVSVPFTIDTVLGIIKFDKPVFVLDANKRLADPELLMTLALSIKEDFGRLQIPTRKKHEGGTERIDGSTAGTELVKAPNIYRIVDEDGNWLNEEQVNEAVARATNAWDNEHGIVPGTTLRLNTFQGQYQLAGLIPLQIGGLVKAVTWSLSESGPETSVDIGKEFPVYRKGPDAKKHDYKVQRAITKTPWDKVGWLKNFQQEKFFYIDFKNSLVKRT